MHLTGLHLILTYRCTFACDHCFVWSSPQAEAAMPLAMAVDAVDQARALGTVEEIYVEGGEPFLHFPVMLEIIRHAASLGLRTGIVTNGYFATTVEDAQVYLEPLCKAGLRSLSVSDDAFHGTSDAAAETPAARTAEAARRLGISVGTICILPPQAIRSAHEKGQPIEGGEVRFRGRAVEKLISEVTQLQPWHSFTECPDEDWTDIGRLHLDPYGYLYPCQGIVVGNLQRQALADIVRTYDPRAHPVIGSLLRGGPAELVRACHLPLRGNYADACHLCYEARKLLRTGLSDVLAPAQVYGGPAS